MPPRHPQLQDLCRQRIQAQGPVTFAQFMAWCLYEPELGYYESPDSPIGRRGDFVTSPQVGADFAELLAEQCVEMWQGMRCPQPFTLVEMGSGSGLLAADFLNYTHHHHPPFWEALHYISLERSQKMRARQQERLQSWGSKVTWIPDLESLSVPIVGCFLSNELIDAMPVHRLQMKEGSLCEIYVTADEQLRFVEQLGPLSTPALSDYFAQVGISLALHPDGYRTEVNLAATQWIQQVAQKLHQGYVLTLDYGHPAQRYYHPNRSCGTLLCYRQHISLDNPYEEVGSQDITAHADFTALEVFGHMAGLQTIGLTQQSFFLANLGLLDRIAELPHRSQDPSATLQRRHSLHTLMDPLGLGNFGVLIQGKGVEGIPVQGLVVQFSREDSTVQ